MVCVLDCNVGGGGNAVSSSNPYRISGHLALFKNNKRNRYKWKQIYDWKRKLAHPEFIGIDEHGITNAYTMTFYDKFNEKFGTSIDNFFTRALKKWKKRRLYLKEQYTTPFTRIKWIDNTQDSAQPDVWYYKDGVITNNRDTGRKFIYFHFMNYKSSQWRHDGTKAPWEGKKALCKATIDDMAIGIVINKDGILPLKV